MPVSEEIEQRAVAAFLGLAVGDALGATVEFMTPREIQTQYGVHTRMRGGGWLSLSPGQVTDDTTMALALGDAILTRGAVDAEPIAHAFDQWMKSKPVDIGNTVRRGVLNFRQTGEPLVPVNEHDAGNGACMRVLPVALYTLGADEPSVRHATERQSHVTHNNPLSDAGTLCVVKMIQLSLQGASSNDLLHGPVKDLIDAHPQFAFRTAKRDNPSGFIVETLQVVFQAFFDTESFEECLVEAVNRGGDADTTGAIAGMIAGAFYGLKSIAPTWLDALDPHIRFACRDQARKLINKSSAAA